jgi:CDP-diacylglycerol--glycerol-3-phosphate 3-phosphatidyltransferase
VTIYPVVDPRAGPRGGGVGTFRSGETDLHAPVVNVNWLARSGCIDADAMSGGETVVDCDFHKPHYSFREMKPKTESKQGSALHPNVLWTLPNALTILRIIMVPFLVVFLLTRYAWTGLAVFWAASFTDWLDGYLARSRGQVTTIGKLLDPVADKLLLAAAFISLVELGLAPAWMVVVIIGRELAVTGLRAVAADCGMIIPAGALGKYKLFAQVIAVSILILQLRFDWLAMYGAVALWVAVALAAISAGQYFLAFWHRLDTV